MSSCCCCHRGTVLQVSKRFVSRPRLASELWDTHKPLSSTLRPRWASSEASPIVASTSTASPLLFQPNFAPSTPNDSSEGKKDARPMKTKEEILNKMVWEAQNGIEGSELWELTSSRYPGIRRQQINLIATLQALLEVAKKRGFNLLPFDLLRMHRMLKKVDIDGQRQLLWSSRFQKSTISYTILLKYAHTCKDARALKLIAREALWWKSSQGRYTRGNIEIVKNRSSHPRVAAADNLTRLIRNLFVSLAVSQRARIYPGRIDVTSGLELPNSATRVTRGDDAFTISQLVRQRVGAYSLATKEEGKSDLLPSRLIKDSRWPITHVSRRRRRINRLIEQGKLQQMGKELSKETNSEALTQRQISSTRSELNVEPANPISIEMGETDFSVNTVESAMQRLLPSSLSESVNFAGNMDIQQMLTQYKPNTVQGQNMQTLLYTYERWHRHLCKRFEAKRTLTSALWQFNLSPRTATQEDLDAIKQVIPAWLLMSILRLHIETGDGKSAERVVDAYLQSQQRIYKGKLLVNVIPINRSRVHAITSPITPPNSATLLNGMLRAVLTSGAADAFEYMVKLIDKWCYLGGRFGRYVLSEKIKAEMHPAGRSLLPDETTVLLLLDSLRHRRKKFSLGVRLIEAMWSRWGIVGMGNDRLDFIEAKMHEVLVIPNQAFVTLMSWALQDELLSARENKVSRIRSMQADWSSKVSKLESSAPPKHTRDEIAAWLNINKRAQASFS